MIEGLRVFFAAVPLAAVALALALGYLFGKLRIGTFLCLGRLRLPCWWALLSARWASRFLAM